MLGMELVDCGSPEYYEKGRAPEQIRTREDCESGYVMVGGTLPRGQIRALSKAKLTSFLPQAGKYLVRFRPPRHQ